MCKGPEGRACFSQVAEGRWCGRSRESKQHEMKQRNKAAGLSIWFFPLMSNQQTFMIECVLCSQMTSVVTMGTCI